MAVVPANPEATRFSDMLVSQLSSASNVVTVERAEFERVLQEQELVRRQKTGLVETARLLHAQGLVVLETRSGRGTNVLSVRLLASGPGVVLSQFDFPLPLPQVDEWAATLARRLARQSASLDQRDRPGVAVSIQGLRCGLAAPGSAERERDLTALLQLALARCPNLFVLERRSLGELASEKAWTPDEEPFWTGAALIDGIIDRDAISDQQLTLHTRVARPGQPTIELGVHGPRDAPVRVIEDLVARIREALGQEKVLPLWNPEHEATEFLRESQWASRWALWTEAANAADAAWALGLRSPLVGAHRVVARLQRCFGDLGPGSGGFEVLKQAFELYQESFAAFADRTNATRVGWASVGMDILLVSARILERYRSQAALVDPEAGPLRELRARCRELHELLAIGGGVGLTNWSRNLQGLPSVKWHTRAGPVARMADVWADTAGIWFEKPDDAVGFYRGLLAKPGYREARRVFLQDRTIPLVGWTANDRLRVPQLWSGLAREMTASSNVQVRVDGWRILLRDDTDPATLKWAARSLFEEAQANRPGVLSHTLDAPADIILSNAVQRIVNWGEPELEAELISLHQASLTVLPSRDSELSYATWKRLIADLVDVKRKSVGFTRPVAAPRPEQVQELIAELEQIQREKRTRWPVSDYIDGLRTYAQFGPLDRNTNGTQAAPWPRRGVLEVSQSWRIDEAAWPAESRFNPAHEYVQYWTGSWQDGALWLELSRPSKRSNRPSFAAIRFDPGTRQSTAIVAPFDESLGQLTGPGLLLVRNGELFVAMHRQLWVRGTDGRWKSSALPTEGGRLHAWGTHLALSGPDVLLDLDPAGGEARILASERRNPPSSALDRHSLDRVPLAVWPDHTLCAVVDGQLWRWSSADGDWKLLASATNCPAQSIDLHGAGAFFRQRPGYYPVRRSGDPVEKACAWYLFGGWRAGLPQIEYYTFAPPRPPIRADVATTPVTRWRYPAETYPHDCQAQAVGDDIWVYPAPVTRSGFESDLPRMGQWGRQISDRITYVPRSLLVLDRTEPDALELELRFTGPAGPYTEHYERERTKSLSRVRFFNTEMGLVILLPDSGVVLWAPRADVDAAVRRARSGQAEAR